MQGQPNPNNLFAYNSNNYNSNNQAILASSHGAFNNPSPTKLTPPPSPPILASFHGVNHGRALSDGDFLDLGGDPFNDFDNDFLSSLLDVQNLGWNQENGGGVCLMDQDGGSGHELKNHNNVQHGNTHLLEEGGGGGASGNELKNHNNEGHNKSCLIEGSRQQRNNEKKKRGPRRYDLQHILTVDPDHGKRLMEGRQYMARSRDKKIRYLSELEEKARFLEFEAINLSAKLTTCQRDKMGLTTENVELKTLLEIKQQQAELRDALSEALTQEVEKLKISNGGIQTPPESFILGAQPNSPLACLSPSQPLVQYNSFTSPSSMQPPVQYKPVSSPSTLQSPLQSSPLTAPSTLQSPLQSSPFTFASTLQSPLQSSPFASPSTLQSPLQSCPFASPSTLQSPQQSSPFASPSTLQSPLQSSLFASASSPHVVSHSPVASPSPSTFKTMSHNLAETTSPQTRNNVFPLPKTSSAALSQLSPLHNSGSSLLCRRGRPANLPTPPK
ncbi:hypothetical protein RHSIM_Rhsim09G0027000 [Rhododendron simsii]|uniref:BZIP domain-containing protein n=1 Tax=Rhododendron simsii TaxID=118357 RepID=A0A834GHC4_RHOSS|nr:hypothetical protein RHSIM_Rhsim09G0027000 [Rhododendron simsii]